MFDAGAIEARLTLDRSQFNRELAAAVADAKRFENGKHEVRVSAVFDNSSMSRARQAFTQLDNVISKDAMARLRSSPQGSVLGALNALFSPHPVTGAPSPQQAAQNGLLGKMVASPGGGGPTGVSRSKSTVATVLGVNDAQIKTDAARAGRDAADAANKAASEEARKRGSAWLGGLLGGAAGFIAGHLGGGGSGGGGGTPNRSGGGSGGFVSNLAGGIGPGILGLGVKTTGIIGLGGAALGALPALLAGAGALGVGGLGAGFIAAGAKSLIGTKNVAGKPPTQGPLFQQAQTAEGALKNTLTQGAQGLAAPLLQAFSSIPHLLAGIGPALRSAFAGAGTLIMPVVLGLSDLAHQVLPLLAQAFRAVAPLLRPLIDGLGGLLRGILPGLTVLLQAAAPAIKALAGGLGDIGSGIGKMLSSFAPVIRQSSVILSALFDVIAALFPIIGQLAGIFARTLAPIFVTFAGIIRSLLPFLTTLGHVLASLAGAVLADLVSAFGALAQLLTAIAPGLNAFARAFSQVFTVLENTGVFAILGDALEGLVKPLAGLINALLHGLTPILQQVIPFVAQLSTIITTALISAVASLLPPLTQLAMTVLAAIAQALPVILPLLVQLTQIFSAVVVSAVAALATALSAMINAIPPAVLRAIVLGILAVVAAFKAFAIAEAIVAAVGAASGWTEIMLAIAAIVVAITLLVTHWNTVWGTIKRVAEDAWHFIYDGFGKFLLPLLGPAGLIALGVIELYQHWSQIWGFITKTTEDAWHAIYSNVFAPLIDWFTVSLPHGLDTALSHVTGWWHDVESAFLTGWHAVYNNVLSPLNTVITRTLPGWFNTAASAIGRAWTAIQNAVQTPVKWVFQHVLDPLAGGFDTITNALGLGHPIPDPIIKGWSTGGKIPGFGGGDIMPALLEPGEAVIDKHRTRQYAWLFRMLGVPGFASGSNGPVQPGRLGGLQGGDPLAGVGGVVHSIAGAIGKAIDIGKITAAIATGNSTALANALKALIPGGLGGAAGEMARILTAIPTTVIKDAVNWLLGRAGGGGAGTGVYLGPGSSNYAADITMVLKQLGLPLTLVANWLRQIQTESGGSLTAVNRTDSNALAGHPSVGLLQLIPSTFASFAGPYLHTPPLVNMGGGLVSLNPMAQIYAAIRYAATRYDGAAMAGVIGHGHGYAGGGIIPEPVLGYGLRSGDMYTFGERGSEAVTPLGGMRGGDGVSLAAIAARLDRLIDVTGAVPAGVGRHVGGALSGSARDAAFRNRYPFGGW